MKDAAACYNKLLADNDGKMPSWKHTGKHIHVVGAVDHQGKQRAFNKREEKQAESLNLLPEAVLTKKENITTFSNIAKMFNEASRLMQISDINLDGLFDYEARSNHFWSTEAGMGQAFAYAQQVIFTVELSLKALLESSGQLVAIPPDQWQTHDLVKLFNMLDSDDQKALEQRWLSVSPSSRRSHKTFFALLQAANHYNDWRYIPTLTSTDLSLDVIAMLSASNLAMNLADRIFIENSPLKIEVTTQTHSSPDKLDAAQRLKPVMVKGMVCSVTIPGGFDPLSQVEVVVQPETYISGAQENIRLSQNVTARFRKSQVESYFRLEGENVCLVGWSTEAEPHILDAVHHRDPSSRQPSYAFECRTLRGIVYNLARSEDVSGQAARITLILSDSTYYTKVDCLFLTDEERAQIVDVRLGTEITICGQATLLNGIPVTLVSPKIMP